MRTAFFAVLGVLLQTSATSTLEDRLWHHRNLGKAFYENPTTQLQAVEEFKKALDLAPTSPRERLNYGLALLRAGKTREAVAELEKVQAQRATLPHTWFNLGIVFKKEGESARALTQLQQMVKLVPNEPIAHYNLGVLHKMEGRNNDAVQAFETAKKLNPTLAAPHFQLYNLYRTTNRPDDAARELQEFQRIKKLQEGAAIPEDMEWCDYAEIYDPLDAAPITPAAAPKYTERKLPRKPGLESISNLKFAAPGDFDNDGLMDLAVISPAGVHLCRNTKTKYDCTLLLKGDFHSALWVDYDHDYDLDLLLTGPNSRLMRNQSPAGLTDHTAAFPFSPGNARNARIVRLDPDSKSFDIVIDYGDRTAVYRDRLNGRYELDPAAKLPTELADPYTTAVTYLPDGATTERIATKPANWLTVQLTGVKNLKLAQGALVEVKAGLLYERRFYNGNPLTFDLRSYKQADTVRITWPNGLIQNEIRQPANRAYLYKEAQRLSGSCPMIWTWNGREFQFLTDVLGIAPLGVFPTIDHDEYVQIPAASLVPHNGTLDLSVTEELSEVTYLDQAALYAVDHPASTEVFVNEKWKSPPFPEFRWYGVSKRIYPTQRTASTNDGWRTLTLDFPNAAPSNRAVLILNGWVDWPDPSSFVNAAQRSKEGLVTPYLQVKNAHGHWTTVLHDMGLPDGKPKTIPVDLSGLFLSSSRELRIVTNIPVHWNEIFLGESNAAPDVRLSPIPLVSANLHFRGFSKVILHPERTEPEKFLYSPTSPISNWNPTPGMYTRYGDVTPLLHTPDDHYVIMGSGDETLLHFDASSLPLVPAGFRRHYLLKVDGWAKDTDANTLSSQTVEPLPTHDPAQSPDTQLNTRPALRLLRSLR